MTLTRFKRPDVWGLTFDEQLTNLRDEINRFFESPLDTNGGRTGFFGWTPAVDLYEDNDHLIVRAELPGMKKDEIELSVHQGALILSGERKVEHEEAGASRAERFYGRFSRSIALPKAVDATNVKATYKDGILTVKLPKAEEAKPKQISVQTS